jgi:hypothetical protein
VTASSNITTKNLLKIPEHLVNKRPNETLYNFMLRIAKRDAEMFTEQERMRTRALDRTEWVPVVKEAKIKLKGLQALTKMTLS